MPGIAQKEFEASLTCFLNELVSAPVGRRIRSTTPLFAAGRIDSLKILDLIAFVERTLGICIPDHKITGENFRTVNTISNTFWKRRKDYAA